MKRIKIEIKKEHEEKAFQLFDTLENVSIFPNDLGYLAEIYISNSEIDYELKKKIEKQFKSYEIEEIRKKNWILNNINDDKGLESELFFISQGLKKNIRIKRFSLIIPANNAFGTGTHESTFLAIKSIEYITKKKKFYEILDLGTGSGILSFILKYILMTKIISTDIDRNVKGCFIANLKKNNLNQIRFIEADGFKSKEIKKKRFDLIVSNMLFNFQKKFVKYYCRSLKKNGNIIISGILRNQENEIIVICNKFNLILKRKFYKGDWVSLILEKKNIYNE